MLNPTHKDRHLHRIPPLRREPTFPALLPTHRGMMNANILLRTAIIRLLASSNPKPPCTARAATISSAEASSTTPPTPSGLRLTARGGRLSSEPQANPNTACRFTSYTTPPCAVLLRVASIPLNSPSLDFRNRLITAQGHIKPRQVGR